MRLSQIKISNLYLALILLAALGLYLTLCKVDNLRNSNSSWLESLFLIETQADSTTQVNDQSFIFPVSGFSTKKQIKPFGIYVEPDKSPVKPERFKGFHTGIDVEFDGIEKPVPVYAVSSGTIILQTPSPGTGGSLILKTLFYNSEYFIYYSHLKLTSIAPNQADVKKGDIIGYLGESGTSDSAGERKHLHFAISKNFTIEQKEYVETKEQLENWIDPKSFYESINR